MNYNSLIDLEHRFTLLMTELTGHPAICYIRNGKWLVLLWSTAIRPTSYDTYEGRTVLYVGGK